MEKKLRCDARKDFLVDGGILYHRADKLILSDAELSMQVRSLISLFRSTRQTQSMSAKTTFAALNQRFFGIKHQEVEFVLKHCRTRAQTKPQTRTIRAPLKPIKVHGIFERIQIDLIDMLTTPGGEYNWILHILTTFQNFRVALL